LGDRELLQSLKKGDKKAVRVIYETYKRDMLGLAVALMRDRTAAEDVVHDAFVSFVEFSGKLKLRKDLRSYLLGCIANGVRNWWRKKGNDGGYCGKDGMGTDWRSPERNVILTERSRRVGEAMGKLPHEQREVIWLHVFSGLKFREIAALQGISVNTVQGRYRYGLSKLESLLAAEVAE